MFACLTALFESGLKLSLPSGNNQDSYVCLGRAFDHVGYKGLVSRSVKKREPPIRSGEVRATHLHSFTLTASTAVGKERNCSCLLLCPGTYPGNYCHEVCHPLEMERSHSLSSSEVPDSSLPAHVAASFLIKEQHALNRRLHRHRIPLYL